MGLNKVALSLSALALASCSTPTPPAFYQQAALPAAAPGSLISAEPFPTSIVGAAAYRVVYNSTDTHGTIIPVSGVIYIPTAAAPARGRNVVAWAHPTTGIAPGCAPSLDDGRIGGITTDTSIAGLANFISAGDVVAATDYPGLGTSGIHPYLIGDGEARSIIDSVRAARTLPGASISNKYVVWGHSQGAQAALFTGQISKRYAPDLTLAGVAAAAPPTDLLHELTEPFGSNSGRLFAAYVYPTWSATYHVPITSVIDPRALPNVAKADTKCISSIGEAVEALRAAGKLNPVFLDHPPESTAPWPALFIKNSPGHAPPGAPLLIIQGTADTTVEPHYTDTFVKNACAAHDVIDYKKLKGVSHLTTAYRSLPFTTTWIAARFAGKPAPDTCS